MSYIIFLYAFFGFFKIIFQSYLKVTTKSYWGSYWTEEEVLDLWNVPAWNLKEEEFFRIGLLDCPLVVGVQLVDLPRVEP